MAGIYQTQVSIPYFTALAEDVVTNVWHHEWGEVDPPSPTEWATFEDSLASFYETVFASTIAMGPWMKPNLTRMRTYKLEDPPPRVPVRDLVVPMTALVDSAGIIPTEVAVCLSYQGTRMSGEPQARRRGRLYLGGLGNTCITGGTTSTFPRVNPTMRTQMVTAAEDHVEVAATTGMTWGVWSRVDQLFIPAVSGWIDDAPDTQRRRGQATSARTTWAVTIP